jgi:hypothetical protein
VGSAGVGSDEEDPGTLGSTGSAGRVGSSASTGATVGESDVAPTADSTVVPLVGSRDGSVVVESAASAAAGTTESGPVSVPRATDRRSQRSRTSRPLPRGLALNWANTLASLILGSDQTGAAGM